MSTKHGFLEKMHKCINVMSAGVIHFDENCYFFKLKINHIQFTPWVSNLSLSDIYVTLKELQVWNQKWFLKSLISAVIEICFVESHVWYYTGYKTESR